MNKTKSIDLRGLKKNFKVKIIKYIENEQLLILEAKNELFNVQSFKIMKNLKIVNIYRFIKSLFLRKRIIPSTNCNK